MILSTKPHVASPLRIFYIFITFMIYNYSDFNFFPQHTCCIKIDDGLVFSFSFVSNELSLAVSSFSKLNFLTFFSFCSFSQLLSLFHVLNAFLTFQFASPLVYFAIFDPNMKHKNRNTHRYLNSN